MKSFFMKILRFILNFFNRRSRPIPTTVREKHDDVIIPSIPCDPIIVIDTDFLLSEDGGKISTESNQNLTK